MQYQARTYILAGGLVLCAAAALLIWMRPLPDVVIIRTEAGFSPAHATIRKGQAVVFKNASESPFWPASDSHPSHGIYPEFDPKRPIDTSWRFVFSKPGVWTFHDHMDENVRGTIVVIGKPGESMRTCLDTYASSSAKTRAECWAAQLTETLQAAGLDAAFDEYAKLYADNIAFRGLSCHDAGHILGAEAYKLYVTQRIATDRPETSYCGYGFYHGFIETMLNDQGAGQYEAIRAYCYSLSDKDEFNNRTGACFHGIGHAIFDSLPGSVWGDEARMVYAAVGQCETGLRDERERIQCADGVFNSLAAAESAHEYGLAFPAMPSVQICSTQKKEYRDGCYKEYGIGIIREFNMDREKALRFIRSSRDPAAQIGILFAYAADETVRSVATFDAIEFVSMCRGFQKETRTACIHGVLGGLNQAGTPGSQYKAMFSFCEAFPRGSDRTACFAYAIQQSKETASDKNAFVRACEAVASPTVCANAR